MILLSFLVIYCPANRSQKIWPFLTVYKRIMGWKGSFSKSERRGKNLIPLTPVHRRRWHASAWFYKNPCFYLHLFAHSLNCFLLFFLRFHLPRVPLAIHFLEIKSVRRRLRLSIYHWEILLEQHWARVLIFDNGPSSTLLDLQNFLVGNDHCKFCLPKYPPMEIGSSSQRRLCQANRFVLWESMQRTHASQSNTTTLSYNTHSRFSSLRRHIAKF